MKRWSMIYTRMGVPMPRQRLILHTEASLGLGGQEIRILSEARWLLDHGWGCLIVGQPASRLLAEAQRADLLAVAVRMRAPWDVPALLRLRGLMRGRGLALDDKVVGLVANVRGSKGHAVFLEAARELLTTHRNARFLIVGDGVGFDDVRRRVHDMGLERSVIMTGFRRDIPEVMASLDVLVLPSTKSEATSQVIPQAFAVGTPVAAAAIGGIPEIVRDGETGCLVEAGNAPALARAVRFLLDDPDRAREM